MRYCLGRILLWVPELFVSLHLHTISIHCREPSE